MRRRMWIRNSVALAAVFAAGPLLAQSTNQAVPPATATPTPTPTPTPAPAGDSVGPPQLRDFNLNGTVTQPAQPATPTPAQTTPPAPRAPAPRPAAPRATPAPGVATQAPAPTSETPAAAPPATLSEPPPGQSIVDPGPVVVPVATAPLPAVEESGASLWPWLAALLAIALGAGFLWWRRQQGSGERYAAEQGDAATFAAPPVADPTPSPRAAPTPLPRAAPPVSPAPAPAPRPAPPSAPIPDGIVSSRLKPVPMSDGIVSSRLKPALAFDLVPIRAETDAAEGAALTFDLIVVNQGSAPARDVLVEAKLINAGPQVDAEIGRFFQQPAGTGDRLPMIAPMGRASLRIRVGASGPNLTPLVVDGRKLLVPMVAINAAYRWSGGELTDSSSFLVGRGGAEGGKMAPFRLDLGARSWSQLGARLHSSGLQR